jgi:hypothetical protein
MTTALAICLTIQLQIINDANVPSDVLDGVRHEVAAIYARAGIAVVWDDATTDVRPVLRFAVKIVPHSLGYGDAKPHVMGVALRETRGAIVYVFSGRVEYFARVQRISNGTMLAHVIAHEIGHLMLPKGWHSQRGLMRGTWDRAQVDAAARGALTFTPDEVRTIREELPIR